MTRKRDERFHFYTIAAASVCFYTGLVMFVTDVTPGGQQLLTAAFVFGVCSVLLSTTTDGVK